MSDSCRKLWRNFRQGTFIEFQISCVGETPLRYFIDLEKNKIKSRTADYSNLSNRLFCRFVSMVTSLVSKNKKYLPENWCRQLGALVQSLVLPEVRKNNE
jgi:hypothetical protein